MSVIASRRVARNFLIGNDLHAQDLRGESPPKTGLFVINLPSRFYGVRDLFPRGLHRGKLSPVIRRVAAQDGSVELLKSPRWVSSCATPPSQWHMTLNSRNWYNGTCISCILIDRRPSNRPRNFAPAVLRPIQLLYSLHA
jgi:hypothetical protein